jgi:hypothetical protein
VSVFCKTSNILPATKNISFSTLFNSIRSLVTIGSVKAFWYRGFDSTKYDGGTGTFIIVSILFQTPIQFSDTLVGGALKPISLQIKRLFKSKGEIFGVLLNLSIHWLRS